MSLFSMSTADRRSKRKEKERKKERKSICVGGGGYFLLLSLSVCCVELYCCRGEGQGGPKKEQARKEKGKAVELRGLVQRVQENEKKCSQDCSVARVVLNRPLASGQTQGLRATQSKRDKKRGGVVRVCICMCMCIQYKICSQIDS